MSNGKNFDKTIKNLLKKVTAKKFKDWHRYFGPLIIDVCSEGYTSRQYWVYAIRVTIRVPSAYINDVIETIVDER